MAHALLPTVRQRTAVEPKEPHIAARREASAGTQSLSGLMAHAGPAFGLGQPLAVQRQATVVQLKDIYSGTEKVGEYDRLNGLESSYKSTYESNKGVGISYRLHNAKETAPRSKPTAVVHAHVKSPGTNVVGISVKNAPGTGGTPWVAPGELAATSADGLRTDMKVETPSPQDVFQIRQVARETGTWNSPHYSGADDYDTNRKGLSQGRSETRLKVAASETVHYRIDADAPWSQERTPKHIYDATTGKLGKGLHKTESEARDDGTILSAWANGDTVV